MKVIELGKTRKIKKERKKKGMKNYKYFISYEASKKDGTRLAKGSGDVTLGKKITKKEDIEEIEEFIAETLNEKEVKCNDVMITNFILMEEIVVKEEGEEDMEKLERLEKIAVKMAELYSRETGEIYDDDLRESIYKILVERYQQRGIRKMNNDISFCTNDKCKKVDCRRHLKNKPKGIYWACAFSDNKGPCDWYWKVGEKNGKQKNYRDLC